jgi:hypothetical protein
MKKRTGRKVRTRLVPVGDGDDGDGDNNGNIALNNAVDGTASEPANEGTDRQLEVWAESRSWAHVSS